MPTERACNLPGCTSEPRAHRHAIGIDGRSYIIDLCDAHGTELAAMMAPYIDQARPGRAKRGPRRTVASRRRSAAIRQWGRDHGFKVQDAGRLPGTVTAAHRAAK